MLFQRFLQHNNMSGTALSSAMMKAYKEGLGVDFALVCQGVTKHVHSQVLSLSLSSIDISSTGCWQAWTSVFNLTASLCKSLALRDLSTTSGHHQC